jgi:hypothetical protein
VASSSIARCSPRLPVRSGTRLARPLRPELSAGRSLTVLGLLNQPWTASQVQPRALRVAVLPCCIASVFWRAVARLLRVSQGVGVGVAQDLLVLGEGGLVQGDGPSQIPPPTRSRLAASSVRDA